MSKRKQNQVEFKDGTLNVKVLNGAGGVYLYVNDVMLAGPNPLSTGTVLCSFDTGVLDLPKV